jgi:hypothetical protein
MSLRSILYRIFGKPVMKAAVESGKDDPELQEAFQGLKRHHDELENLVDTFCDRFPDHPKCK